MIIVDIVSLISQVHLILEYFVPGFVFIWLFTFLTTKEMGSNLTLKSVIVSYIIKSICECIHKSFYPNINLDWSAIAILLFIFAVVTAIFFAKIADSRQLNKVLIKLNNKSIYNDIWKDLIDYQQENTYLRITCGDIIYTGRLIVNEEKGFESWFALDNYTVNNKGKERDMSKNTYGAMLAINLSKADSVEIFYPKGK